MPRPARGSGKLGDATDPSTLAAAIERLPLDAVERAASTSSELRRMATHVAEGLAALEPWRGDLPALRALRLPTEAEAKEARRSIEAARFAANSAREVGETAEASAIHARMRLKVLTAAGPLPTAVAEARARRDDSLTDVRSRLTSNRRADDGEMRQQLAEAVRTVDLIVDQRDGDWRASRQHVTKSVGRVQLAATQSAGKFPQDRERRNRAAGLRRVGPLPRRDGRRTLRTPRSPRPYRLFPRRSG